MSENKSKAKIQDQETRIINDAGLNLGILCYISNTFHLHKLLDIYLFIQLFSYIFEEQGMLSVNDKVDKLNDLFWQLERINLGILSGVSIKEPRAIDPW